MVFVRVCDASNGRVQYTTLADTEPSRGLYPAIAAVLGVKTFGNRLLYLQRKNDGLVIRIIVSDAILSASGVVAGSWLLFCDQRSVGRFTAVEYHTSVMTSFEITHQGGTAVPATRIPESLSSDSPCETLNSTCVEDNDISLRLKYIIENAKANNVEDSVIENQIFAVIDDSRYDADDEDGRRERSWLKREAFQILHEMCKNLSVSSRMSSLLNLPREYWSAVGTLNDVKAIESLPLPPKTHIITPLSLLPPPPPPPPSTVISTSPLSKHTYKSKIANIRNSIVNTTSVEPKPKVESTSTITDEPLIINHVNHVPPTSTSPFVPHHRRSPLRRTLSPSSLPCTDTDFATLNGSIGFETKRSPRKYSAAFRSTAARFDMGANTKEKSPGPGTYTVSTTSSANMGHSWVFQSAEPRIARSRLSGHSSLIYDESLLNK